MVGWLVGWLGGWLVGWLAGWVVGFGWLAGWVVGWLVGWLVRWLWDPMCFFLLFFQALQRVAADLSTGHLDLEVRMIKFSQKS